MSSVCNEESVRFVRGKLFMQQLFPLCRVRRKNFCSEYTMSVSTIVVSSLRPISRRHQRARHKDKRARTHTHAHVIILFFYLLFFPFFHFEAILILSFELRPSGDPRRAFPSHTHNRRIRL